MKQLARREKQVIELVSKGRKSREIAKDLGISIRTVDAHRSNVLRKYGVKNSEHAVRIAIERGDIVLSSTAVSHMSERAKLTKDIITAMDEHLEQCDHSKVGKPVSIIWEKEGNDDDVIELLEKINRSK
jgi:DNA-binding CsgD family transcriptional regulator